MSLIVAMPRANVGRGIEIEYEVSGRGEPLVLIMGIGAQLIWWPRGFIEGLSERYRVIRFDNRDVGLSTKLEGERVPPVGEMIGKAFAKRPIEVPYTLTDMADDVAGLLDHLNIPGAHIVGVSMGGMIAQTFAITHPHRVMSLTSIMSHPGGRRYVPKPKALKVLLGPAPKSRQEAVERAERFYGVVGSTAFEPDLAGLRERAGEAYERGAYPPGFLRHFGAILASGSRRQALRFMRRPSAVIHGTVDPLVPPRGGRDTYRNLPDANLHLIEGMGHDLPPGVWTPIIGAIDSVTRRVDA